jgi:hypothetical protein
VLAQIAERGHVVGMDVGIQGEYEADIELAQQLQIAGQLLLDRIDEQSLAAWTGSEQVRVRAASRIEELSKQHRDLLGWASGR